MNPPGPLPLPSDATAPERARKHSREVLGHWDLRGIVDPVLLVVSELVTNAVRHGRPPVQLRLRRDSSHVRIEVHDGGPRSPEPQKMASDAESGRGLGIVKALSEETGVDSVPDDGKITWARIAAEAQDSPDGT